MEWMVWPWGRWEFRGKCTDVPKGKSRFEAEIIAVTDADVPGVVLRAPTKDEGMVRLHTTMHRLILPVVCIANMCGRYLQSNTSVGTLDLAMLCSHSGN